MRALREGSFDTVAAGYVPVITHPERLTWLDEDHYDLEKVKVHGPPKLVEQRSDCPAIVVSPQCPNERIWSPTQLSLLLDKCMETLKVDPDRVYVTGLSMGGFGTWALCAKEPERFAAAVPICGGGDVTKAARLVDLPIHVFHGAKDTVVTPDHSQKMVDALNKQVNAELYSAYLYQAMASDASHKGFPGTANWFSCQTQEEVSHAQRLYNYVNSQGAHAVLAAIEKPPSTPGMMPATNNCTIEVSDNAP